MLKPSADVAHSTANFTQSSRRHHISRPVSREIWRSAQEAFSTDSAGVAVWKLVGRLLDGTILKVNKGEMGSAPTAMMLPSESRSKLRAGSRRSDFSSRTGLVARWQKAAFGTDSELMTSDLVVPLGKTCLRTLSASNASVRAANTEKRVNQQDGRAIHKKTLVNSLWLTNTRIRTSKHSASPDRVLKPAKITRPAFPPFQRRRHRKFMKICCSSDVLPDTYIRTHGALQQACPQDRPARHERRYLQ